MKEYTTGNFETEVLASERPVLVSFSAAGVLHQVGPEGEAVWSVTASLGGALGYAGKCCQHLACLVVITVDGLLTQDNQGRLIAAKDCDHIFDRHDKQLIVGLEIDRDRILRVE